MRTTSAADDSDLDLSIIVPVMNEEGNVQLLREQIHATLGDGPLRYEILYVDDGSRDSTPRLLADMSASDPRVRAVMFRRNFGQTAAMQAGIDHARGDVIVFMDGDLQNDPADIPRLLAKLDEGFDLVHGWRKDRQDTFINRRLPSRIANWLISRSTGFPVNDLGCSLKAIRREIAEELELYGEMHRFIPILAHRRGARCAEMVTHHRARHAGQTKYGISRTTRVVLDLLTVLYLLKFFDSPMKLFGRIGMLAAAVSVVSGVATLGMKFVGGVDMTGNPLLLQTMVAALAAIQFFSLGLVGEVCARIYYSRSRRQYAVRTVYEADTTGTAGLRRVA